MSGLKSQMSNLKTQSQAKNSKLELAHVTQLLVIRQSADLAKRSIIRPAMRG